MGKIHAAKASSPRLQRVLDVLREGSATSWDLIAIACVCAPGTCVSELRERGYDIECIREARDRWRYTLISEPVE